MMRASESVVGDEGECEGRQGWPLAVVEAGGRCGGHDGGVHPSLPMLDERGHLRSLACNYWHRKTAMSPRNTAALSNLILLHSEHWLRSDIPVSLR